MAEEQKPEIKELHEKAIGEPQKAGCLVPVLVFLVFIITAVMLMDARRFEISLVFVFLAALSPPALRLCGNYRVKAQVRMLHVDESGIKGHTFGNRQINIRWEEITRVYIGRDYLLLTAPGRRIKIRENLFTHYETIFNAIMNTCTERDIECIGYM